MEIESSVNANTPESQTDGTDASRETPVVVNEPEKKKAPPIAKDTSRITVDKDRTFDSYLDFDDGDGELRYPFKFRKLPWKRLNQLRLQAMTETNEEPDNEERRFQELYMDDSIISIADRSWAEFSEYQMDGAFGEALRLHLFNTLGISRMNKVFMGKLVGELKPLIHSWAKESVRKAKRI